MTSWMMETLLWTAVLIAFVLLVRRPVSRHFGPQMAYALWALPALRLFLPPIELPSWMRLTEEVAREPALAEPTVLVVEAQAATPTLAPLEEATLAAAPVTDMSSPIVAQAPAFDFSQLPGPALAIWLIGAVVFLALRFSAYFRLRDELLEGAREMGRSGKVRLIETPGTKAPLAFGVIDKVIALPEGFLAHPDRQSRDLALEHELQHHKGQDLLANILVQPLFAIHWWNPLGRYGWLALRRDQEAACDARVMADAASETREAYANLIVSFAATPASSPAHALTAPMACPVLGEKSIIHRLRSLKMENTNTKQRVAGKLMLGAAVVALPLTASISYAATEIPAPAAPPEAPSAAPGAPTPPAPPAPPEAPAAPFVDEQIIIIDPDGEVSNVESNGDNVFVLEAKEGETDARVFFQRFAKSARPFDSSDFPGARRMRKEDFEKLIEGSKNTRFVMRSGGDTVRFIDRSELNAEGQLTDEQIDEIMVEVRESLEEANQVLDDLPSIIESAMAEAEVALEQQEGRRTIRVERSCDGSDTEVATTTELSDGTQIVKICQARVMSTALQGLKEAREGIKKNREMSERARERALREIDRTIDRWEDRAK